MCKVNVAICKNINAAKERRLMPRWGCSRSRHPGFLLQQPCSNLQSKFFSFVVIRLVVSNKDLIHFTLVLCAQALRNDCIQTKHV